MILSPIVKNRKGTYEELFQKLLSQGFTRVRVNGNLKSLEEEIKLDRYKTHNIDLVIDRLVLNTTGTAAEKEDGEALGTLKSEQRKRITDSVELALSRGRTTSCKHY